MVTSLKNTSGLSGVHYIHSRTQNITKSTTHTAISQSITCMHCSDDYERN